MRDRLNSSWNACGFMRPTQGPAWAQTHLTVLHCKTNTNHSNEKNCKIIEKKKYSQHHGLTRFIECFVSGYHIWTMCWILLIIQYNTHCVLQHWIVNEKTDKFAIVHLGCIPRLALVDKDTYWYHLQGYFHSLANSFKCYCQKKNRLLSSVITVIDYWNC